MLISKHPSLPLPRPLSSACPLIVPSGGHVPPESSGRCHILYHVIPTTTNCPLPPLFGPRIGIYPREPVQRLGNNPCVAWHEEMSWSKQSFSVSLWTKTSWRKQLWAEPQSKDRATGECSASKSYMGIEIKSRQGYQERTILESRERISSLGSIHRENRLPERRGVLLRMG